MSLAQFTGQTADQCNSYTTDGTAGWKLAALEDMGLIKSNVDKINASLAKLPNVPQIETNHGEFTNRLWKTSNGTSACMVKDVAINAETGSGCDRSVDGTDHFDQYSHALCIRTFSAGGAGKDPITTPTTYKVGDVYTNDEGVAIGTVFEISDGGTHGTILSRTSRTGTQAEAVEYCDSLNASTGLTWGLPTYQQMVTVCSNNISGYARYVEYWTGTGNRTFEGRGTSAISCDYGNSSVPPTENFSYFCAAAF